MNDTVVVEVRSAVVARDMARERGLWTAQDPSTGWWLVGTLTALLAEMDGASW